MKPALMFLSVWCIFAAAAGSAMAAQPGNLPPAASNVETAGKAVQFRVYDRPYFVKNTFEPGIAESFAVLASLQEFEGVCGVGMVMGGQKPRINEDTFKSQIIVAVVKRGPMCQYTIDSVTAKGNRLELRYTTKTDPPGTSTFAVPLIVAVPKGGYVSVAFIENGKEIVTKQIVNK